MKSFTIIQLFAFVIMFLTFRWLMKIISIYNLFHLNLTNITNRKELRGLLDESKSLETTTKRLKDAALELSQLTKKSTTTTQDEFYVVSEDLI